MEQVGEAVKLGRPVDVAEAAACARAQCRHCYGTGKVTRVYGVGPDAVRLDKLCTCAQRRFFKRNAVKVAWDGKQQLCWKDE